MQILRQKHEKEHQERQAKEERQQHIQMALEKIFRESDEMFEKCQKNDMEQYFELLKKPPWKPGQYLNGIESSFSLCKSSSDVAVPRRFFISLS